VKYAVIKEYQQRFDVRMMCRVLSVSRSGYYAWDKRPETYRDKANAQLAVEIKDIFDDEKQRVGSPRITQRLRASGHKVSKNRVARLMRQQGWRAKGVKKFKATTNSRHNLPVAPNILRQDFEAEQPNQKWVSDLTYIWTNEGWLYLAVVLDLYSRLVVGWAMAERMTATLVCDALKMALWRRKNPTEVIVHSDRGVQYCSKEYQDLLDKYGLFCSMSKKGDCFDNAAMESWNGSLKVEAIHGEQLLTREEAKKHVFEYIEVYYNRRRLHSKLGYISPESFEKQVA
jgi:transposase InsO family protein